MAESRDDAKTSPKPPVVGRLDTLPRCRKELVRLYREARLGELATGDATRLAHIVGLVGKMLQLPLPGVSPRSRQTVPADRSPKPNAESSPHSMTGMFSDLTARSTNGPTNCWKNSFNARGAMMSKRSATSS